MKLKLKRKKARPSYPIIEVKSNKTESSNENKQKGFKSNDISTTKYTRYNFIFKNLFEQFKRITNIYFLAICVITLIPQVSPLSPVTSLLPLIFVLVVTAIKEAFEDYGRYKADKSSNYSEYQVYRDGQFASIKSKDIVVGDLIKIQNNQAFPSDILVLSSNLEDGICYVETAQLDGETNLKLFKASKETNALTIDQIIAIDAKIECELPNNNLYKFKGKFTFQNDNSTFSLSEKQLMLRGARLRNTHFIYGIVLYCGKDTKLSLNQKNPPSKFSTIETRLGRSVIGIFCFKVVLVIIATFFASFFEYRTARESWYMWGDYNPLIPTERLDRYGDSLGFIIVKNFVSYFAILSFLIPMSLMVTLEVVKVSQARLMEFDDKMSYKDNKNWEKKPAAIASSNTTTTIGSGNDGGDIELSKIAATTTASEKKEEKILNKYMSVKNSNLNDELALIKYIFSDKTGTLTENRMLFSKCSINGKCYDNAMGSQLLDLVSGSSATATEEGAESSATTTTTTPMDKSSIREFLINMSVCHAAVSDVDEETGLTTYQSQSPDEISLCDCAKVNQFEFINRSTTQVQIRVMGKDINYELLAIMEFTSDRRRMSVLLREPINEETGEPGKIILYSKGADSIMIERLSEQESHSELLQSTVSHISDFSREGLRTLILAKREISTEEYAEWSQLYHEASTLITDREVEMDKLNDRIERDFQLVGCTAIEDKLQDGVPESIDYLLKANIKVWIITGDKQETAINIGYSCKLLVPEIPIIIINADSTEDCGAQIQQAIKTYVDIDSDQKISMVVNGESLTYILKDHSVDFLRVAAKCHSVVACRVTPLQKALIVRLVKKSTKQVCLSIGDGANDVSMIQEAHIGIGIYGNEGSQAARASDYALLRFRHLTRLITVHGRYSMVRNSLCIKFSLYKNMAFFLCQFWFSIFSGWSAMTLYDSWIVTTFNILMTSVPPYFMALFEKDINDSVLEKNPQLYKEVQDCHLFQFRSIGYWLVGALYHSLVFFFGLYFFLTNDDILSDYGRIGGKEMAGAFCATYAVFAILFKASIEIKHWNVITTIGIFGSMLVYIVIALVDSAIITQIPNMFYVFTYGIQFLKFYVFIIIMVFIALLPDFTLKFVRRHVTPTNGNILQEEYVLHKRNKNEKQIQA